MQTHRDTSTTADRRSGARRRTADDDPGFDVDTLTHEAERSVAPWALAAGFVVGVLIAVAVALVVVQNTESVPFEWLGFDADAPMWLLLVVSFAAGLIAGPLLLGGIAAARVRRQHRLRTIHQAAGRPD